MPPNNTVIMQNNFVAGRVSGTVQDTQLRFANAAGSSAEFDFVKPSAGLSFTDSAAYRFALDPSNPEEQATFSYSHGAVSKRLFLIETGATDGDAGDVYLNADNADVGNLHVTGTATIANLIVDKLYASTVTVVNETITVNIYATDGGIDVADGDEAGAGEFVEIVAHVASALGIDADDGDADVAIGATGGRGDLAEKAGLTGDEGGATADE